MEQAAGQRRRWPFFVEWAALAFASGLLLFGLVRLSVAAVDASHAHDRRLAAQEWSATIHSRFVIARDDQLRSRRLLNQARVDLASIRRAAGTGFANTRALAARRGEAMGIASGTRKGRRAARLELSNIKGGWYFVGISWVDGLPVIGGFTDMEPASGDAYSVSSGEFYYRETGY